MKKKRISIKEVSKYWRESSEKDLNTMLNLYKSKDYNWSLFIGHLVLEKLLKALFVNKKHKHPIFTHDLLRLAKECDLQINEEKADMLDTITTFNINARYDNYRNDFYNLCTKEFASTWINNIIEIKKWLEKEF